MIVTEVNKHLKNMRNVGESLTDQGFIEINLGDGTIPWMNEYMLSVLGYTAGQLKSLTLYDLVPNDFHETLSNILAEKLYGRDYKFGVWPFKSSDNNIIFWYTIHEDLGKEDLKNKIWWYRAIQLDKTSRMSSRYASMMVTMNLVNGQNDIRGRLDEHKEKTHRDIERLEESDKRLEANTSDIRTKFSFATSAMEKAATASMAASSDISRLRTEMQESFTNQTMQIMRLIGTDTTHDVRMATYEKHLTEVTNKAVASAVQTLSEKTDNMGTEITIRANNAGKSLTRKVTVPVGAIAFIMTVFQWLITNWKTFFPH